MSFLLLHLSILSGGLHQCADHPGCQLLGRVRQARVTEGAGIQAWRNGKQHPSSLLRRQRKIWRAQEYKPGETESSFSRLYCFTTEHTAACPILTRRLTSAPTRLCCFAGPNSCRRLPVCSGGILESTSFNRTPFEWHVSELSSIGFASNGIIEAKHMYTTCIHLSIYLSIYLPIYLSISV